jgi:hypothetical protein
MLFYSSSIPLPDVHAAFSNIQYLCMVCMIPLQPMHCMYAVLPLLPLHCMYAVLPLLPLHCMFAVFTALPLHDLHDTSDTSALSV